MGGVIAGPKTGYKLIAHGALITTDGALNGYKAVITDEVVAIDNSTNIDLLVGADSSPENKINIKLAPMNAKSLGVSELSVDTFFKHRTKR